MDFDWQTCRKRSPGRPFAACLIEFGREPWAGWPPGRPFGPELTDRDAPGTPDRERGDGCQLLTTPRTYATASSGGNCESCCSSVLRLPAANDPAPRGARLDGRDGHVPSRPQALVGVRVRG